MVLAPLIMTFARTYAVYIVWPVAAVVGFVGYWAEEGIRRKRSHEIKGATEKERIDRQLDDLSKIDCADVTSLKKIPEKFSSLHVNDHKKLKEDQEWLKANFNK